MLLTARRIIEFSFTPLLVAALPNDYVVADFSKRRQYAPADRGTAAVAYRGESTTEFLVDFIEGTTLRQFPALLDD